MKIRRLTIVLAMASLLLSACHPEGVETMDSLATKIRVAMEGDDPATKVDVHGVSGVASWTAGDEVAVYIAGPGANAYETAAVNTGDNSVTLNLTGGRIRGFFAVYPASARDDANYGNSQLNVVYARHYDIRGKNAESYSPVPMVADNDPDAYPTTLHFYHVGGLLRIALSHVPATAEKIRVEFSGMEDITGIYRVLDPGTDQATTKLADGTGNVVDIRIDQVGASGTTCVNIPLPTGKYDQLDSLLVDALDGTGAPLGHIKKRVLWTGVEHAQGKKLALDFLNDAVTLTSVQMLADTASLWKSQGMSRTATAMGSNGSPIPEAEITWSCNNPTVASVDPETGHVRALAAGFAEITATATYNGDSCSATYVLGVNHVTQMEITNVPEKYTINVGGSAQISDKFSHTNYGTISYLDDLVTWESSDPSVISIAFGGASTINRLSDYTSMHPATLTGVESGQVTITCTVPARYSANDAPIVRSFTMYCVKLGSMQLSSNADTTMWRGATMRRTATAYDSQGNVLGEGLSITWESSQAEVAVVDANGVVTTAGRQAGVSIITARATYCGITLTSSYRVNVNTVASIEMTRTAEKVNVGGTSAVTATVRLSGNGGAGYGTPDSYPTVSFASNAPTSVGIAPASVPATAGNPITAQATATGVNPDTPTMLTATIPAEYSYNGSPVLGTTTVQCVGLASVVLSDASEVTLWKNGTVQRTATAMGTDGSALTGATITWSSSAPGVATVNATTGEVRVVGPGSTVITATARYNNNTESVSTSYNVFGNVVESIELTASPSTDIGVGGTTTVTATLTHTNNGTISSYPSNMVNLWSSSQPSRVSISNTQAQPAGATATTATATATATGVALGNSTVSAQVNSAYTSTGGNLTGQIAINCVTMGLLVLSDSNDATLWKTETVQRTATAYDSQNNPVPVTVTWSSDAPAVASVASDGTVTALSAGDATITASATYNGSTSTAQYFVHVNTVSAVSVAAVPTTVGVGGTSAVTATLTHTSNGTITTYPVVSFSSATPSYVSVSPTSQAATNDGSATTAVTTAHGIAGGSSTITATVAASYSSTGEAVSDAVTVTCVAMGSIVFEHGTTTYTMWKSQTYTNTASVVGSNGQPMAVPVSYATSNSAIATVSGDGTVTGTGAGVATITASATSNGSTISETYDVAVNTVTAIAVTPSPTANVNVGGSATLTATLTHTTNGSSVFYTNYPDDMIGSWVSGSTSVVTLSNVGLHPINNPGQATCFATATANAIAAGSSTVTATVNPNYTSSSLSNSTTVVSSAVLSDINLAQAGPIVKWKGGSPFTNTPTAIDGQGNPVAATFTYASQDPAVASVVASGTGAGVVTPLSAGTTTITVTATYQGAAATKTYTVAVNAVSGVSVTASPSSVVVGGTSTITATFTLAGGGYGTPEPGSYPSVTFASDNGHVTVPSGAVTGTLTATTTATGTSAGTSSISATVSQYTVSGSAVSGNTPVTCSQTFTSFAFANAGPYTKWIGQAIDNVATATVVSGLSVSSVTYSSSNEGVATVSSTGHVVITGAGTATITATATASNNETTTTSYEIYANSIESVSVVASPASVAIAGTSTVTATIALTGNGGAGYGTPDLTGLSVAFASNNGNVTVPGTPVTNTLSATTTATGAAVGSSTITATVTPASYISSTGSGTGSATVTCSAALSNFNFSQSYSSITKWKGQQFTNAASATVPSGYTVEITYSASPAGVATVDTDGKVTITGAGTTTVTATATVKKDGVATGETDTRTYTVYGNVVQSVSVAAAPTTVNVGGTSTVTATITLVDGVHGTPESYPPVSFTNSADGHVTVPASPVTGTLTATTTATGVSAGESTITATVTDYTSTGLGVTGSTTITCASTFTSFAFASAGPVTKWKGEHNTNVATATVASGLTVTSVAYQSLNTGVATVDENTGEVTFVNAGTTTIRATATASNGQTTTAEYTVNCNSVAGVTVAAVPNSVAVGGNSTVTATIALTGNGGAGYGTPATYPAVSFTNSADGHVTVPASPVTGTLTASTTATGVSGGTSIITATVSQYTASGSNVSGTTTITCASGITSVTFAQSEITKWKGESFSQTPTVVSGLSYTVAYASGNTGVATVDPSSGTVNMVGAGTAVITATVTASNGDTATATYTVNGNHVTGISVAAAANPIVVGGTTSVTATITHTNNGTIASYPAVSFVSATTSAVTVSPASQAAAYYTATTATAATTASGVAAGSSVVTASVPASCTSTGSALTDDVTLAVRKVLESVTFGETSAVTLWRSKTVIRTATANATAATGGGTISDATITYSSSNTNVATVAGDGTVTAVAAGTATITASCTYGGVSDTDTYLVYVNEVTATDGSMITKHIVIGATVNLVNYFAHTDNSGLGEAMAYPNDMISWSVTNPQYVNTTSAQTQPTFKDTGIARFAAVAAGLANGTSIITATVNPDYCTNGAALSAVFTVVCATVDHYAFDLVGDQQIWRSQTMTNVARAYDSGNNEIDCFSVVYTSDNNSTATVDSDGTVHGLQYGIAIITATFRLNGTEQGSISYRLYVNEVNSCSGGGPLNITVGSNESLTLGISHTGPPVTVTVTYPSDMITWSNSDTQGTYISLTSAPTQPFGVDNNHGTATAIARGRSVGGPVTVTATIKAEYCSGGTAVSTSWDVQCTAAGPTLDHLTFNYGDQTLWKRETFTNAARAYDTSNNIIGDATITYSVVDGGTYASVNSSTGQVAALAAGEAIIEASCTYGGVTRTARYRVSVNEITVITVSSVSNVAKDSTITVTAVVTHTNNGSVTYPTNLLGGWVSASPSYVSLSDVTTVPVSHTATTATYTAKAHGVSPGDSQITVPANLGVSGSVEGDHDIRCQIPTFNNLMISTGFLQIQNSQYSLGNDQLEIVRFYGGRNGEPAPTTTEAHKTMHYFSYDMVAIANPPSISEYRLPTSAEWNSIIGNTGRPGGTVNGRKFSRYVKVRVDVENTIYSIRYGNTNNVIVATDSIPCLVLFPDNATITLTPRTGSLDDTTINMGDSNFVPILSYSQCRELQSAGCTFLPLTGYHNGSSWQISVYFDGRYWASSGSSSMLLFDSRQVVVRSPSGSYYQPVRLVKPVTP